MAFLATPAWAQNPADCQAAPTNMGNAGYPRVCPDNTVMFKLLAPGAQEVLLQPHVGESGNGLGEGPFAMTKGEDGVWSITLGPVRNGFHYYHFVVDGLPVSDPGSDGYANSFGTNDLRGLVHMESGLEIPEQGVDFYLPRDVPHGVVQELWYKAELSGEYRRAYIYTPPGYDQDLSTRYPVLYLQHGGAGGERNWVEEGRVSFIMDNLLAEGKITPMLVVMERGVGNMAQTAQNQTIPFDVPTYTEYDRGSRQLFAQIVVENLIPTIDGRYRTIADREHRAIAGLSRGGDQAANIGLANLDTFSSVGIFSQGLGAFVNNPAAWNGGVLSTPAVNEQLDVLWVSNGTVEGGYPAIKTLHDTLTTIGVEHVYFESEGTAHEWLTWRRALYNFAPLLFKS
ncbi:MAG: alpha/beta hydrolase-fold protein [Alphaproteobacteria bacterium]